MILGCVCEGAGEVLWVLCEIAGMRVGYGGWFLGGCGGIRVVRRACQGWGFFLREMGTRGVSQRRGMASQIRSTRRERGRGGKACAKDGIRIGSAGRGARRACQGLFFWLLHSGDWDFAAITEFQYQLFDT